MYWMYGLIIMSLLALYYFQDGSQTKNVDWTQFESAALKGDISKIEIFPEQRMAEGFLTEKAAKKHNFNTQTGIQGEMKLKTTIPSSDKIQEKIDAWNAALMAEGKPEIQVNYEKGSDLMKIFWYFGPVILIFVFMYFMSKRMTAGPGGGDRKSVV